MLGDACLMRTPDIKISAIVCTFNRKSSLPRCLDSLVSQSYRNYEIIVVDDGSTDGTDSYVRKFTEACRERVPLRYVRHDTNRGIAAARNTGVRNAAGRIIVFTDDDCRVVTDWVEKIAKWYAIYPAAGAVGGLVVNGCKDSVIAEINQNITTHHLYDKRHKGNYTVFLVGNNMSYRKEVLEDIGLFKEKIRFGGDEDEIQRRIMSKGYKMIFAEDVVVTHFQRNTLRSFLRQYYKYGYGLTKYAIATGGSVNELGGMPWLKWGHIFNLIVKPYKVGKHVKGFSQKALCFPLVYLSSLSRGLGLFIGRLSART